MRVMGVLRRRRRAFKSIYPSDLGQSSSGLYCWRDGIQAVAIIVVDPGLD
jgi:hypothetical protein